jgi:uncharacterized membrane protein YagU involved in acid resistance
VADAGPTRSRPARRGGGESRARDWGFGIANGAVYGIVVGSLPSPKVRYGLPFGASVWSGGYMVLPLAKLYEPIWKYHLKVLANDLSAHLLYGLTTAAAFRLLSD